MLYIQTKSIYLTVFSVMILSACHSAEQANLSLNTSKPNILLIVADDLGFTDIGINGGEIETPNIDALAQSGLQFTSFYASPTCSPTRAMLLTGSSNHMAGLGMMDEVASRFPDRVGIAGYEGHISDRVETISTRLSKHGYNTFMAGKWHLGDEPGQTPDKRGFLESFALMEGGASHFSDARGVTSNKPKANYLHNGRKVTLDPSFFSSDSYTDILIRNIADHAEQNKPFFAYAAYTAPHWPLQAPKSVIDKYRGLYNAGYDQLKKTRLAAFSKKHALEQNQELFTQIMNRSPSRPWESLNKEEKEQQSRSMEIYAAMVDNLDSNIGRLVSYLRDSGQLENTVIIFLSDNGAAGEDPIRFLGINSWVNKEFDQSFDNMGKENSFAFLGAGWASAVTEPFRLFKGVTTEGGMRVPAFIHAPNLQIFSAGKTDVVATVKDITPTLLEIAGISVGNQGADKLISGESLIQVLGSESERFVAWELHGNKAVRKGQYKLLSLTGRFGDGKWHLYDIASDPSELTDISSTYPEKKAELLNYWEQYKNEEGVLE